MAADVFETLRLSKYGNHRLTLETHSRLQERRASLLCRCSSVPACASQVRKSCRPQPAPLAPTYEAACCAALLLSLTLQVIASESSVPKPLSAKYMACASCNNCTDFTAALQGVANLSLPRAGDQHLTRVCRLPAAICSCPNRQALLHPAQVLPTCSSMQESLAAPTLSAA